MKRKRIFERAYSTTLRTLVCQDCGQMIETGESPSFCLCPNCGGRRMNIKIFPKVSPRKSVFENHDTELESKLKEHGGKTLSQEKFQKEFSVNSDIVLQKCFAEETSGGVYIKPEAYGIEKAFSKIVISVTKSLELDPTVMSGCRPCCDVIKTLPLGEKSLTIIKKAHCLPEDSCGCGNEDWVKDSKICEDLKAEFGGETLGLEEFIKIIRERYPDAPKNIYDILEDKGAISLDGTKVNILH